MDAVNGNLSPVYGNLGGMEKQQFSVIILRFLFVWQKTAICSFLLLSVYYNFSEQYSYRVFFSSSGE